MTIIEGGKQISNFSPAILRFSIVPKHFESNMLLECAMRMHAPRAEGSLLDLRWRPWGLFQIVEPRLKIHLGNSGMSATNESLSRHLQLLA
jgi:hypothetical protein